jgi:diguanylate cyclase (GGDEF)-like protein
VSPLLIERVATGASTEPEGSVGDMIAGASSGGGNVLRAALGPVRRWPVWSVKGSALAYVLAIELLAFGAVVFALYTRPISGLTPLLVLAGLSIAYSEAADRIETFRRYLGSDHVWSDSLSVSTFAGVFVLPLGCAGILIGVLYGHTLLVGRRRNSVRPYRQIFSCATVILAAFSAAATYHLMAAAGPGIGLRGTAAIALALAVYTAVNLAIMMCGVYLAARPPQIRQLLPGHSELEFELATLILGVVTAVLVLHTLWLTPVVLALIAVLHRSALVAQLTVDASTDSKTGLLNAGAWRERARQHLQRAHRASQPAAVLLIDLDHFKVINDTHGHLVGDLVLHAVACCLTDELRGYDAIGRYGGEEFVILLTETESALALEIGERLRQQIRSLGQGLDEQVQVTASIGLASYPADGLDVDQMLAAADAALYAAKRGGRDRVSAAPSPA